MRPQVILLAASMLTVSSGAAAQEIGDARGNIEPATELRSPGLITGGVGLILAGGGGASALFYAASQVERERSGGFMGMSDLGNAMEQLGLGLGGAVLAAGSLGGGIPMIAVGAERVPKEPNGPVLPSEPLWLMPSAVTVGPTSVAMTWSF